MARSKIIINFLDDVPLVDDVLIFQETKLNITFTEVFKAQRLSSNQSELPTGGPIYTGYVSNGLRAALALDYNASNLYSMTKTLGPAGLGTGSVTVEALYDDAEFVLIQKPDSAGITIENETVVPIIKITNISITEATTNKCQNVKVNVTTDLLAVKVLSPVVINPNTDNPFSFDFLRGQTINVLVEDSNGKQASQSITLPSVLTASNFIVTANNSPNGATAVITNTGLSGLTLQYSLDNATWQSSNVFTGLTPGDFTAYIKDQYGCSTSLDFNVSEFNIYVPYFLYSKANSIRMAERVTYDYVNTFPNDENTLSCEAKVLLPYKEVQEWQSDDIITTQIRSNYDSNIVKTVDSSGDEVIIPIYKKSNNIGLKDKRDAIKYNLSGGKTGIYFNAGNIYDYDTNAVTGSYVLNGGRPEWARVGNYIQIDLAWFQIEQIIYDEIKASDVLVISNVYTGIETSIVVGSIYNRENFEVYEYIINMIDYLDNDFRVKLDCTSEHFAPISLLSEQINVQSERPDLLSIAYWNNTNTDINYSTGIKHLVRVPFNRLGGKYDDETENYKTDSTAILLSSELYELDEVVFEPNTKEIWRKLNIALSHENVSINRVDYAKNAGFTSEGPLEQTNLYVLSADMVKKGNVYNSKSNDDFGYTDEPMEIPNLLESDSGYIEI